MIPEKVRACLSKAAQSRAAASRGGVAVAGAGAQAQPAVSDFLPLCEARGERFPKP